MSVRERLNAGDNQEFFRAGEEGQQGSLRIRAV